MEFFRHQTFVKRQKWIKINEITISSCTVYLPGEYNTMDRVSLYNMSDHWVEKWQCKYPFHLNLCILRCYFQVLIFIFAIKANFHWSYIKDCIRYMLRCHCTESGHIYSVILELTSVTVHSMRFQWCQSNYVPLNWRKQSLIAKIMNMLTSQWDKATSFQVY